jgi:hypothetical protein
MNARSMMFLLWEFEFSPIHLQFIHKRLFISAFIFSGL